MAPQGMRTVMTGQYSSPCRASSPFGDEGRQGWVSPIMTVHRVDSGVKPGNDVSQGTAAAFPEGPCPSRDGWATQLGETRPRQPYHATLSQAAVDATHPRPTWLPRQSSTTVGPSCQSRGPAPRGLAPLTGTSPDQGVVYVTRPVYITQDSGRANVSLKETFVAG
jgi:hypothetical protein